MMRKVNQNTMQVLPRYEAKELGLSVPVFLCDSVLVGVDDDGDEVISLPDLDGLIAAAALVRIHLPVSLTGREVRFMRNAMNMTSVEFAHRMDVDPATVSRWEAEKQPINPQAEKLLRVFVLDALGNSASGVSNDLSNMLRLDVQRSWVRTKTDPIELRYVPLAIREDHNTKVDKAWVAEMREPEAA